MQAKYTYWLFLAFFVFLTEGMAQQAKPVKIFLEHGAKIEKAYIQSMSDTRLMITLYGTDSIAIPYNRIRKISFRGKNYDNPIKWQETRTSFLKTKSFFHELRGGLLFGEENTGGTLHTINGYQFNRYLGTGIGVGLNRYGNLTSLPVYASVKGYLFDRKVTPFYFADIGYGHAWKNYKDEQFYQVENLKGGYYWQVGLGYQVNFYNSAMTFALGYSNQDSRADYVYTGGWWRGWTTDYEVSEKRLLRRLSFTVGFLF